MGYLFQMSTTKPNCVTVFTDGKDNKLRGRSADIPVPLIVSTYQTACMYKNDTFYTDFIRTTPYVAEIDKFGNEAYLRLKYIKNGKDAEYVFNLEYIIPKHLDPFAADQSAQKSAKRYVILNGSIQIIDIQTNMVVDIVDLNSFLSYLRKRGYNFSANPNVMANINAHLKCSIVEKPLSNKTLSCLRVIDPAHLGSVDFELEYLIAEYIKDQSITHQDIARAKDAEKNVMDKTSSFNVMGKISSFVPLSDKESMVAKDDQIKKIQENFNKEMAATLLDKLAKDKEIKELKELSLEKDKLIKELKAQVENLNELTKQQNDIAQKLAQKVIVNTLANQKLHKDNTELVKAGEILSKKVKTQRLDELTSRIEKERAEMEMLNAKAEIEEMKEKSFSNMIKKDATQAIYRVGATQMMNALRAAIVALLQKTGKDNQTIQVISDLLDSDIGVAILSCICGYSVDQLVEDSEVASKFAEELRVSGMALAGNAAFETLFGLITSSIVPILSSLPKEQSNVRIDVDNKEDIVEEEIKEEKLLRAC